MHGPKTDRAAEKHKNPSRRLVQVGWGRREFSQRLRGDNTRVVTNANRSESRTVMCVCGAIHVEGARARADVCMCASVRVRARACACVGAQRVNSIPVDVGSCFRRVRGGLKERNKRRRPTSRSTMRVSCLCECVCVCARCVCCARKQAIPFLWDTEDHVLSEGARTRGWGMK